MLPFCSSQPHRPSWRAAGTSARWRTMTGRAGAKTPSLNAQGSAPAMTHQRPCHHRPAYCCASPELVADTGRHDRLRRKPPPCRTPVGRTNHGSHTAAGCSLPRSPSPGTVESAAFPDGQLRLVRLPATGIPGAAERNQRRGGHPPPGGFASGRRDQPDCSARP